jgi:hypothetical protein
MHKPYELVLKHKADFRVRYRFRTEDEGGRKTLPFQGLRCDFSYSGESGDVQYIVWPEFEDANGNVILENDHPVPNEGTALMWVIIPERRIIHKEKIKAGTKGFFREGPTYIADCDVIEIIDLFKNPTEK